MSSYRRAGASRGLSSGFTQAERGSSACGRSRFVLAAEPTNRTQVQLQRWIRKITHLNCAHVRGGRDRVGRRTRASSLSWQLRHKHAMQVRFHSASRSTREVGPITLAGQQGVGEVDEAIRQVRPRREPAGPDEIVDDREHGADQQLGFGT